MPLFKLEKGNLIPTENISFPKEKDLQKLIEENLEVTFNCKLISTEFSTGEAHGGRIDTLAHSEDQSPVILEYKNNTSSELIT